MLRMGFQEVEVMINMHVVETYCAGIRHKIGNSCLSILWAPSNKNLS